MKVTGKKWKKGKREKNKAKELTPCSRPTFPPGVFFNAGSRKVPRYLIVTDYLTYHLTWSTLPKREKKEERERSES